MLDARCSMLDARSLAPGRERGHSCPRGMGAVFRVPSVVELGPASGCRLLRAGWVGSLKSFWGAFPGFRSPGGSFHPGLSSGRAFGASEPESAIYESPVLSGGRSWNRGRGWSLSQGLAGGASAPESAIYESPVLSGGPCIEHRASSIEHPVSRLLGWRGLGGLGWWLVRGLRRFPGG
jgi:hypothetical protein